MQNFRCYSLEVYIIDFEIWETLDLIMYMEKLFQFTLEIHATDSNFNFIP